MSSFAARRPRGLTLGHFVSLVLSHAAAAVALLLGGFGATGPRAAGIVAGWCHQIATSSRAVGAAVFGVVTAFLVGLAGVAALVVASVYLA